MTEKIKLILAVLLLAAGVGAFYLLAGQEYALVLRVLAVLAGVAAAAAVMWTTPMGKSAFNFSRESVAEAKKVVWPTRKETLQTTMVVFALVVAEQLGIQRCDADTVLVCG